jgi:hypothetical protein
MFPELPLLQPARVGGVEKNRFIGVLVLQLKTSCRTLRWLAMTAGSPLTLLLFLSRTVSVLKLGVF